VAAESCRLPPPVYIPFWYEDRILANFIDGELEAESDFFSVLLERLCKEVVESFLDLSSKEGGGVGKSIPLVVAAVVG